MKQILTIIVAAAFAVSASAHCGKCETGNSESHKCTEACKDSCKAKEGHTCTDACKDKCAKKNEKAE